MVSRNHDYEVGQQVGGYLSVADDVLIVVDTTDLTADEYEFDTPHGTFTVYEFHQEFYDNMCFVEPDDPVVECVMTACVDDLQQRRQEAITRPDPDMYFAQQLRSDYKVYGYPTSRLDPYTEDGG